VEETTLMPDVEHPLRNWEVVLTVPLDQDRDALVPPGAETIPRSAMGVWSATQAVFSVPVKARGLLEAGTLGLAALGEWADAPGASASVRPVPF
jgi:hypothetical protein